MRGIPKPKPPKAPKPRPIDPAEVVGPAEWFARRGAALVDGLSGCGSGGGHQRVSSSKSDDTTRRANVAMMIVPATATTPIADARP